MLTKSKKEKIIKDLEDVANESESLVFINFHGMNVADETELRRQLRKEGVGYKVSRKTLLRKALEGKATGEIPELPGEVAVAYLSVDKAGSKDPIAPVREIYNFQKSRKGLLNILGGIFEGKFTTGAFMMELATIPSKEVLLSKLAYLLRLPMQRLAIALNEVSKKK